MPFGGAARARMSHPLTQSNSQSFEHVFAKPNPSHDFIDDLSAYISGADFIATENAESPSSTSNTSNKYSPPTSPTGVPPATPQRRRSRTPTAWPQQQQEAPVPKAMPVALPEQQEGPVPVGLPRGGMGAARHRRAMEQVARFNEVCGVTPNAGQEDEPTHAPCAATYVQRQQQQLPPHGHQMDDDGTVTARAAAARAAEARAEAARRRQQQQPQPQPQPQPQEPQPQPQQAQQPIKHTPLAPHPLSLPERDEQPTHAPLRRPPTAQGEDDAVASAPQLDLDAPSTPPATMRLRIRPHSAPASTGAMAAGAPMSRRAMLRSANRKKGGMVVLARSMATLNDACVAPSASLPRILEEVEGRHVRIEAQPTSADQPPATAASATAAPATAAPVRISVP